MEEKLLKWEEILKPGTIVFPIYYNTVTTLYKKCKACKGVGYISKGAATFTCDTCQGIGRIEEKVPEEWRSIKQPQIIHRVEISQSKEEDKYAVMYWLGCNGYHPKNIFTTLNAATKECNKRNRELENDK